MMKGLGPDREAVMIERILHFLGLNEIYVIKRV